VEPEKVFRAPSDTERAALEEFRAKLAAFDGENTGEALQGVVFEVGREHFGKENMRDWFKALYEVLLGASQGPRFGGFVALYGVDETVALIDKALAGELS
jgi:lysyl-tRNA synthetase class 1